VNKPFTVACVFVKGNYPYTLQYVVRLERMARRYLLRPFRFVCLTDQAAAVRAAGIEPIAVARLDVEQAYWHKVHLFNPEHGLTGRVLFLDLDVLVVAALDPIVDHPAPFVITADPPRDGQAARDKFGRRIVRKFNSSVMAWAGGTHAHLFHDWSPAVADELSGDQDWIGEQYPDAATLPAEWFPRISSIGARGHIPEAAKVVLVKTPKNHLAAAQFPWFEPLWGGWAA